mgnify:CR=1 FL=1
MREHTETLRIGFGDTDSTGRVYFPAYVRWIDNTMIELLRDVGVVFSPNGEVSIDGRATGLTLVIGEYRCRMDEPSTYDDEVIVRVTVKELRRRVIVVEGFIIRPEDGRILAHGNITYVCVNLSTSKSTEIPWELITKLS